MITDEYKALLTKKHVDKPWGGAGKSWVPHILNMMNRFPRQAPTILDYGCGRGTFKDAFLGFMPDAEIFEYDPGVPGKNELRMIPVDLVVCTDVMEHVEEQFVPITLRTLNWLAVWGVFFNIDTALSKSFLPDGRNTHITIKPSTWWKQQLNEHMPGLSWTVLRETRSQLVIHGIREVEADV